MKKCEFSGRGGALRFLPAPLATAHFGTAPTPLEGRLVVIAGEAGFELSHDTQKMIELVHRGLRRVIYVSRDRLRQSITIAVIVPPWFDVQSLTQSSGLTARGPRHGSNLRAFPMHVHNGRRETHCGYSVDCSDVGAYCRLIERLVSEGPAVA